MSLPNIYDIARQILTNQEKSMAVLDDLTKAVSDVQAAVAKAVTLIQSLHMSSGGGSVSDAEVEAAVASLEQASMSLGAAVPLP